jgi:hypothetical protein
MYELASFLFEVGLFQVYPNILHKNKVTWSFVAEEKLK